MATRIQLRRDTAANWTSVDPTLSVGEAGVETDTLKVKVGDGSTAWTALTYVTDGLYPDDNPDGFIADDSPRIPPDPSAEDDHRILRTVGGALEYTKHDSQMVRAFTGDRYLLAWDNFEEEGNPVGKVLPSGQTWAGPSNAYSVDAEGLYPTGSQEPLNIDLGAGADDIRIRAWLGVVAPFVGFGFRYDNDKSFINVDVDQNNNVRIRSVIDGSYVVRHTKSFVLAAGAVASFEAAVRGDLVVVWVDDTFVTSYDFNDHDLGGQWDGNTRYGIRLATAVGGDATRVGHVSFRRA